MELRRWPHMTPRRKSLSSTRHASLHKNIGSEERLRQVLPSVTFWKDENEFDVSPKGFNYFLDLSPTFSQLPPTIALLNGLLS